jgi:hypothetical protein
MLIMQTKHVLEFCAAAVLLVGPIPLSAVVVANRQRGGYPGISHICLSILVLWCLTQTGVGLLLGMAHGLSLKGLLTVEAVLFATGVLLAKFYWPKLGLQLGRDSAVRESLSLSEMLIVLAIGFVGLALLRSLLQDPIEDYDSLAFHLPIMTTWYQSGSLSIPLHWDKYVHYPFSWEVLCTIFLFPFGEDYLVAFPNLVAWIIFGLSVYLLSRTIGVNRLCSMAAGVLVMLLPIMREHVTSLHIDLPLGAFFLCSLYYMISYLNNRSSLDLFLFIASIGMVCGIKTSGLVYGLALLCPIALLASRLIARNGSSDNMVRRPSLALGVGIGVALLVGAVWYIRNLIEVGNPLGFVTVRVGGVILFQGIMDTDYIHRSTLASLFDVTDIAHWKILYGQILKYLSLPFFMLVLAGSLLPVAVLKDRTMSSCLYYGGLMGLLFATGYMYWHSPYSGDDGLNNWKLSPWMGVSFRYGFPFIGLIAVAAAVGFGTFRHAEKYWIGAVLVNAALFVRYGIVLYAFIATILIIVVIARLGAVEKIVTLVTMPSRAIVSVGMIILVGMSGWLGYVTKERRAEQREVVYGGTQKYIREHVSFEENIAYVSSTKPYPLYGKELNRKVIYASRLTDDFPEWVATLRAHDVAVVAVGPLLLEEEKREKEVLWLQSEGRVFERVFGDDVLREMVLYRVRR